MANFDARVIVLALRIAQAMLALIVLGLAAYVANWWSGYWHSSSPSEVNFLIFSSVWSVLALLYLIIVPWRFSETALHHKFAIFGIEAATMIFWFAGFVALAVFLSDRVCFGHVCAAAKATAVFAAFEWALFVATFTMASLHVMRTRGRMGRIGKADPNVNVAEGV
ncbi:Membrane-associating domain [Teratosphaeria destructans]|uniref:Membrane-associating domain n=1 Tax=Teratosphaeria destructans TaxID=418781 RepID=A0A9W7W3W9_9PEZI|nr:Membrane-associating domain [Teratosphaeria destructans]